MAANLTPQYLDAQENYRKASTPDEELRWLQVMYKELPKHKASEKMQAELKTKISNARKEVASGKSAKKSTGVRIPRQGAGTVLIIGGPNAGKSQLLASLTRATPEVADYPFTTRAPLPGMMPWEDVYVQLIDTPPITMDYFDPNMHALIRGADLCLLMVDLGNDDGIEQVQELLEKLGTTKTRLAKETYLDEEDIGRSYTQTICVLNKQDAAGFEERLEMLREFIQWDFPEFKVSATDEASLAPLKDAIFKALNVVRVYSKLPTAKQADFEKPFTLRTGSCVLDFAGCVHKDFVENFKHARIWGSGIHDGSTVKGDHIVNDKDIVELHISH